MWTLNWRSVIMTHDNKAPNRRAASLICRWLFLLERICCVILSALFISDLSLTVWLLRLRVDWWHCPLQHARPPPPDRSTPCVPASLEDITVQIHPAGVRLMDPDWYCPQITFLTAGWWRKPFLTSTEQDVRIWNVQLQLLWMHEVRFIPLSLCWSTV